LIDGRHSAAYFKLNDAERRRLGVPRVDRHIYSRENGWAITALAVLSQAATDTTCLIDAQRAARWVIEHRSLDGGGFRHDEQDSAGPYLGDTLAMTRAFLSLYAATQDRAWLDRAQHSLEFVAANFRNTASAGYAGARAATDAAYRPHPERDENVALARAANAAWRATGDAKLRKIAEEAMRYVVTPQVARAYTAAPTLLADAELTAAR
jgi:uncharacterized protein